MTHTYVLKSPRPCYKFLFKTVMCFKEIKGKISFSYLYNHLLFHCSLFFPRDLSFYLNSLLSLRASFNLSYTAGLLFLFWLPGSLLQCASSSLQRADFSLAVVVGASLVVVHRLSCCMAYGILAPHPGAKLMSLALEGGFLTTGTTSEVLSSFFLNSFVEV